jgi:hypothetical protein
VATQILVSRAVVEANDETGALEPVFTAIADDETEIKGTRIYLGGPATLKYDPTRPRGRRVWIQTFDEVIVWNGSDIAGVLTSMAAFGDA